ncbi:SDR family NAD(P)-dependent oxidoreductase [Mesorhizobium shangrilense]|uniref:SDR family oxidoreductase n=1 Tax=Mesorhizobium shangrilense TaxID=460060 RepID=A0ABV2DS76_9HYPH
MTTQGLLGRNAIVTGGSRGIGAAIALAFARAGANVAVCHDDDDDGGSRIVEEICSLGRVGATQRCDVADAAALTAFIAASEARLGPTDILVNNAGVSGETPFEAIRPDSLDRMLDVHVKASFRAAQQVYPGMRERRWGRIINITSQLAYKGAPGLTHYCAAKAALIGFTRALAHEAAPHNVLVNAIAPGPVDTRLNDTLSDEYRAWKRAQLPLGRFGKPDEIAPTAVLLASSDGDYYVGQTLSPNGGDVMF